MKGALLWWCVPAAFLVGACATPATPTPQQQPAAPAVAATPTPVAQGTTQTPWVRDRVRALEALYNLTAAGSEWLERYDLRQMVGQPGWFGSFGFDGWAGVGQAKPVSIIHELSHSYFGAFPVTGHPDLVWDRPPGGTLSTAQRQYREDLKTFMAQPPDRYEPLRDRFRNLPNLSRPEDPDLTHFGEAELVYSTGGNLNLVPPILRKYWSQFLQPGDFQTWDEALRWYLGLSSADARLADGYFGLVHFPLATYSGLRPQGGASLPESVRRILEGEERQRLKDFAGQFELIKTRESSLANATNVDRGFQFWRGLLREMLDLHRRHPQVLAQEAGERGARIAVAFDTFLESEGLSPREQAALFRSRLQDPFLLDFVVLLSDKALVELFAGAFQEVPQTAVAGITRRFAQKLEEYLEVVDTVVGLGRTEAPRAARELERFLATWSDEELENNLTVFLDLLREAEPETAGIVVNQMSDQAILRILENNPGATLNGNVEPERLLQALDIAPGATRQPLVQGLTTLLRQTSGNFQIDAPFTRLAYQVVADVGAENPEEALAVLRDARIPLAAQPFSAFLLDQPRAAVSIFAADIEATAKLIATPHGYAETPQGTIHALIPLDPVLAARLVETFGDQGRERLVADSLIVFAYDAPRLEANPKLRLSLEKDRDYLVQIMEDRGQEWLRQRMEAAIKDHDQKVRQQLIDENFIEAYRTTLRAIIAQGRDTARTRELGQTFDGAFVGAGLPPLTAAP